MAYFGFSGGKAMMDAHEAMEYIDEHGLWDVVVDFMDDELREQLHDELAPCSNLEFLEAYLDRSEEDLYI